MTPQALETRAPAPATTSTMGVVSLAFALICWLALPLVGSLVAIACGHVARREIRESRGALTGDGLAVTGLVLGYLHLATVVIGILVALLLFGGIAAALAAVGILAATG